jgi:2-oxo-4-hydroxy-4-carboxy-5-ureidoimidazoline decarboxylase
MMEDKMLAEKPSAMSREHFLRVYASVYEHSPWVAESVYDDKDTGNVDTVSRLSSAMRMAVDMADRGMQLSLIRAHPELAVKTPDMAPSSVSEQSVAGLDQCSTEELAAFKRLNQEYREKFGFPFIVAVKGMTRAEILDVFKQRLQNDADTEFQSALQQIHKIARFRLEKLT